jgi:hypothetical protein
MDPDRLQILIWAIVVTVFLFSGIIGFILFVWNQYQIDQHYVAAVALALKEFTARMDTINPPTRVEHDRLINEVAVINQGPDRYDGSSPGVGDRVARWFEPPRMTVYISGPSFCLLERSVSCFASSLCSGTDGGGCVGYRTIVSRSLSLR